MKNKIILFLCVLMFAQVSYAESNIKVGVVDLQKVVDNSAQVRSLKQERNAKISELNSIITKAQTEIAKESDMKKIVEIQDKYTNEFNLKKSEIEKIYASKILKIEQKIRSEIEKKAKESSYDYIFAKSVVFHGGEDITNDISNKVNK